MNLGQLKTHVTNATGNDAVSAHLVRLANQVQYDICSRYPFSWRKSLPVSLTCTANQPYISSLSTSIPNYGDPVDAYELSTPQKLIYLPNWDIFLQDPNYLKDPTSVTGVPTHYSIDYPNDRLWLYPTPNSAISVYVRYLKLFTELSSDSDTFLVPAQFHFVLCDGVESRVWQLDEDLKSAQAANQRYEAGISKMIELEQQIPDYQPILNSGRQIIDYSYPFLEI